jgi:hypothetical protein
MAEVPMFSNGNGGGNGGSPEVLLCSSTYDEPKHRAGGGGESHVCDEKTEHPGPHFCSTCGSHWVARVGVLDDDHVQPSGHRQQVALARMDASLIGVGLVLVTRPEPGRYTYQRVDPQLVLISEPEGGWGEQQDVARATAGILKRKNAAQRLDLLIRDAESRDERDKHRNWVHISMLKGLLDE